MNDDQLFAVLASVHDEDTFVQFLIALRDDREASITEESSNPSSPYSADAGGWENTTVERLLDAAVNWARSSANGLPLVGYVPPANPWRRCADILYAAKGYE